MPLKKGYSEASISHNIRDMRHHHSLEQALAVAYFLAREAYQERHPGKALPARLRPEHQRRHHEELRGRVRHSPTSARRPARKKAGRRRAAVNPASRAERAYAAYHGATPTTAREIYVPDPPADGEIWWQGRILEIAYITKRDGKTVRYLHKFRAKSAPQLAVSGDGKNMYFAGGRYLVTDRGIEDL